jgi:uncharacterized SAM-binding protein YcdF (DUF218 family)
MSDAKRGGPSFFGRLLKRAAVLAGAACLAAWAAGFAAFVLAVPGEEAADYGTTDGVAVLTGGQGRLLEGLIILEQQIAGRMLVSGVGGNATVRQLLASAGVEGKRADPFAPLIDLDYGSQHTADNAEAVAAWIKRHRFRHIRLITSNYHMPRAMYELRQQGPAMAHFPVVAHPVFSGSFAEEGWRLRPASVLMLLSEYHKLLAAMARHYFPELLARVR